MGFISSLEARSSLQQVGHPRDPVIADWFGGGSRSNSGVNVTPDSAMRVTAVFRCVAILSQTFASLPLHVYRILPNGGKEIDMKHPLYSVLHDQPNEFQTSFEWREMMWGHFALRGRCYSEIISSGGRAVEQLIPLHPDRVRPFRAQDGRIAFEYTNDSGISRVILQDEMHYMHLLSMDGVNATSPIGLAREAVGLSLATEEHGAKLFSNGTRMGGVLKMPGHFRDPVAKSNFRKSWNETQSGLHNAHRVAILEDGMEWQSIGMTSEDSQFLETRNFQLAEIARIFGIPPHKIGDLSRCMPGNTQVYTEHGNKNISDIVPGEMVWSPTSSGLKLCNVLNNWENGEKEIITFKTTNRTVRCTAEHRLLVRRQMIEPLKNGQIGGKNINGKKYRVLWYDEYVKAKDICVDDVLLTLGRLPDNGAKKAPNGRKLTEGFMSFVGLLVADGNISYENGKPRGVCICHGDDASYIEDYKRIAENEFAKKDGSDIHFFSKVRASVFSSTTAGKELHDLGFSGTCKTKSVPWWVFKLDRNLKLAFLRGFLDGDGTVNKKGQVVFYSTNLNLLHGIRHLCMGCGIPVTNILSHENSDKAFSRKDGKKTLVYRFTCSDPGANSEIGSYDLRYIERFKNGVPFGRKDRGCPRFGGNAYIPEGLSLARIKEITVGGVETTYDIEVEDSHCFIADGVISHNSTNNNIEHQGIEFVQDTVRPGAVRHEQAFKRDLFTTSSRKTHSIKYNLDGLMRGDSSARTAYYASGIQWGWLSPDEARSKEDYNPRDDGKGGEFLRPANMLTASQDTEQGEEDGNRT